MTSFVKTTVQPLNLVIMSATPLHVQDIGETVQLVGVIISYHTLGMFLLSPVLGSYVDKYGYKNFTYIGTGILFVSCLTIFINSEPLFLKIGLYLLGLGWNFNYVAISSAISKFSIKNSSLDPTMNFVKILSLK